MALCDNLNILEDSLQKARKYNDDKNYGRSFAHYLVVFQLLTPESRLQYEKEFTDVLHIWGSILHNRKKFDDIFKCYDLATLYFPNSKNILNNLGVHALKLKNLKMAKIYFENSLNIDRNFLPAEQNLQTTKFMLVERWNFPMLNDKSRNESYGKAIAMEISKGFKDILDIGTGTGILSLFASKINDTRSIVACDYSEIMFNIAKKVFNANMSNNIKLINKSSTDLIVTNDLEKRATLLVTEIFDSGVFGENILETLIHAWKNLLFSVPYAKVIPSAVAIYVTGIQSDTLSRKVRLSITNKLLNINKLCLAYLPMPYDTENIKFENVSYITDNQLALYVNFNSIHQLKLLLSENNTFNTKLNVVKTGKIDAFVVWFKLYLNESISITNDPLSATDSCWEQAIFYLHHPLRVEKQQELNIKMSCSNGYIDILYNEMIRQHENCFLLPKSTILFLNDPVLMECIADISKLILDRFKSDITILDLSPFPILGLLLAKHGKKLTFKLINETILETIWKLCEINDIERNNINIVMGDHQFTNEKFDVIFQNFINPCGLLNEEEIYNCEILKYNLSPRGIYIPEKLFVCAQLVQCDWLNRATRVSDENLCGFKVAEFMNEYKSTEQRDIKLNTISHVKLSEPLRLDLIKTENISREYFTRRNCTITQTGYANAIFYWFEIELIEGEIVNTQRIESYTNNACFMLDSPISSKSGDNVCLVLKQHRGILKIYVE